MSDPISEMRLPIAVLLLTSLAGAQNEQIVRVRSTRDFTATVIALDSAINAAHLKIFGRVDHAANARGVGLDLRPTTVFIFGNPQVGTRLMQCEQTAAIDLPLRVLVWEDSARTVFVGYEPPARLAERHKVPRVPRSHRSHGDSARQSHRGRDGKEAVSIPSTAIVRE